MDRLELMSSREAGRAASEGALALVPFGSVEQHCEAQLGADLIIAGEIASRACRALEEEGVRCVLLPPVPYGYSPEWSGSPGTISLRMETLAGIVYDVLESLWRSGFRAIALVNGHGGNSGVLEAAARGWAAGRPGSLVVVVDYWRAAGLRLGHCCRGEERLLSEALGRPVRCECRGVIGSVPGARAIRIAGDPTGLGMPGQEAPGLDEVALAVARVIAEALGSRGMTL